MNCIRCRPTQKMYRVKNTKDGSAIARCARCSMERECAYCPNCGNTSCLPCYNKPPAGAPPKGGPIISDNFSL